MNQEGISPSTKRMIEFEEALGYRWLFDKRGMPRIGFIMLFVGFTAILVLFAVFVNGLWWIPAGIFVFVFVMMSFSFVMVRHRARKEERKEV